MKKVLYVIDTLQTGGAERSTLEIASRLQEYQSIVCQVYAKDDLSASYKGSKIIFENFGLTGKYEFKRAIQLLRHLIQKYKPVVVIGTLMRAEIIARIACHKEGVPVLGTFVNDTYAPEALNAVPFTLRLKIRFFQILNAYTARYCVGFISNSEAISISNAKALGIPSSKIEVIHRGRDASRFRGNNNRSMQPPFCFVNVGRLLERKGQLDLIRAFHLYDQSFPGSELLIAGEGPFHATLFSEIFTLGLDNKVRLLGNVQDIPGLLVKADCFVFPSHYEGFSGALVEAAFAGVPVIASNISMNKEVMKEEHCTYFKVNNVNDLAASLFAFAQNAMEAHRKAEVARAYAIGHFDINHIVSAHVELYTRFSNRKKFIAV